MAEPIVSWFEASNAKASEIKDKVDFGRVDADTESPQKVFYIWNNRNGAEDVSKMEEVTFTTRDRSGGTGDTQPNIVEAVRDNWFQVRVDSLNEMEFTPVGKIATKPIGTNGTTVNPKSATASSWASGVAYVIGDFVKPTVANTMIYKVTKAGTTGGIEPSWTLTDGNVVTDQTVEYIAIKINKTPAAQEILGVANNVSDDGSNAANAGGNFAKVTVFADVPIDASSGKNLLLQRVSFRYV